MRSCSGNGSDKIKVNVELSRDVYDLLYNYCNWRSCDIDSLVEQIVFERINSDIGFRQNLKSKF